MAFAIKLKKTEFSPARWIERHVPLSRRAFGTAINDIVEQVSADGHELRYIRESYTGIPIGPAVVHTWRGEMAQFIFENLPY
jgi:hypothetical protein